MLDLWYRLEFAKDRDKGKFNNFKSFFKSYLLPSIITVGVFCTNGKVFMNFKDTLTNTIIFNLLYLSIIHLYVQKKFFLNLNKDLIVKFLPNRINDYISLRLLMIFIKAYIPVIIPSILFTGIFFENSKIIFYLSSLMIMVTLIIANILISIYWRYFLSTAKRIYIQIGNFIAFVCIFTLFILISVYTPISILINFASLLKGNNIKTDVASLNIFALLFFTLLVVLALVVFRYSKNYIKVIARVLVLNREIVTRIDKNLIVSKVEEFYKGIYSINLSTMEKYIFNKDVSETIRESKYSLFFIIINQIISIGVVLFFFFSDKMMNIEESIFISKLLCILLIGQGFLSILISKTSMQKHINIENDFEVLEKYGIKFTENNIIKAKIRLLSAMVFPKIYLVGLIMIVVSFIKLNSYLGLIYIFSMIQLTFIENTMKLWVVKSVNKLNSTNEIINKIGLFGIFASIAFIMKYPYNSKLLYLYGQLAFLSITAIVYIFQLTIDKARSSVEGGKSC